MTDRERNPLRGIGGLPDFAAIRPEHVRPAVEAALADAHSAIAELESDDKPDSGWLKRFEAAKDRVRQVWAPVDHLHSVTSTPELREAFNDCLPLITGFWTELGQNRCLYNGFLALDAAPGALTAAEARIVELGLRDFRLAGVALESPDRERFRDTMLALSDKQAAFEQPAYNRFPSSFAHIFGGGYSAGYYSYKWAEVLAADAFAAFSEAGAFDARVADRFRRSVLAVGGSREALEAFVDFRGREPRIDALLEQSGIAAAAEPAA